MALKLVIYDAKDLADERLSVYRNRGVLIERGDITVAFDKHGEKLSHRNVNVSTRADFLKDQYASLTHLKLKHVLSLDESHIWAAYFRAIIDPDQPVLGMDDSEGYYRVVGEFFRSELRRYQTSLVIAMSA